MAMASVSSRKKRGFTLLEVLAAVAILSIWFIVLMGSAIQGLRAEGVSKRRLEAAMIADRKLSELEAASLGGTVPEATDDVSEEGEFTVTVVVRPFVEPSGEEAGGLAAAVGEPAPPLDSLLASELPERGADLRRMDVTVAWTEGAGELQVTRTSFAFDLESALEDYEAEGIEVAGEAAGEPSLDDLEPPSAEDLQ